MRELHFRINRLEQYIMTMGYPLPSMGSSDDVVWVYSKAEIAKQQEQIELLREALIRIRDGGISVSNSTFDIAYEALAATAKG